MSYFKENKRTLSPHKLKQYTQNILTVYIFIYYNVQYLVNIKIKTG